MDEKNQQQQKPSQLSDIVKTLKDANNILIIISRDPSIDQLSASIGLTLALNKANKHATAVFSGNIPPILEFLEPDKTLEKNTDSLRDFIISLDKSKADKLRYKVEDNVVRIFITPYKTSISDADLDFSQGDFNVDAIVALGVHDKGDLDEAIVAHGRILHDATIISISNTEASELGSIHWVNNKASSLSEMTTDIITAFDNKLIDSQTATALLTGVVYETDRFRNEKSSPHTMSVSGILMEAGASTQLVAAKLEEKPKEETVTIIDESEDSSNNEDSENQLDLPEVEDEVEKQETPKDPGLIEIDHTDDQIHIDDSGQLRQMTELAEEQKVEASQEPSSNINSSTGEEAVATEPPAQQSGSMIYQPPTFGGQLTANSTNVDQQYTSAPDPLSSANNTGNTLTHDGGQTLTDLEKSVNSPHVAQYQPSSSPSTRGRTIEPLPPSENISAQNNDLAQPEDQQTKIDYASSAVERAVATADYKPEPIQALNAQPIGLDLGKTQPDPVIVSPTPSGPPPPVPPPMMPQ